MWLTLQTTVIEVEISVPDDPSTEPDPSSRQGPKVTPVIFPAAEPPGSGDLGHAILDAPVWHVSWSRSSWLISTGARSRRRQRRRSFEDMTGDKRNAVCLGWAGDALVRLTCALAPKRFEVRAGEGSGSQARAQEHPR